MKTRGKKTDYRKLAFRDEEEKGVVLGLETSILMKTCLGGILLLLLENTSALTFSMPIRTHKSSLHCKIDVKMNLKKYVSCQCT